MAFRSGRSRECSESWTIVMEKSKNAGAGIAEVEVTSISRHGFWLYLAGRELFVSFTDFPWFAEAPVSKIVDVKWPSPNHLYWPELDIDLSLESIENPAAFPLLFDNSPGKPA
jgi:hypothetical protein